VKRTATAEWKGALREGAGVLSSASGALKTVAYGFKDRFEDGPLTNPEELIAAAHAGCFSMALSGTLGGSGLTPESIRTQAAVNFEKVGEGWSVTGIHLDTVARVPGTDAAAFAAAAEKAKQTCPISRLLSNIPITLSAKLEDCAAKNVG